MIDSEGYRPNVGIILVNRHDKLFWARRIGQRSWQFPQGGIKEDETPEQALYRELWEEVGLREDQVEVLGCTSGWLRYQLPAHLVRRNNSPVCIGQKQIWFMLRLATSPSHFRLDHSEKPEFDFWRWVDYWQPVNDVITFKRRVYEEALRELAPLLFGSLDRAPPFPRRPRRRYPLVRG